MSKRIGDGGDENEDEDEDENDPKIHQKQEILELDQEEDNCDGDGDSDEEDEDAYRLRVYGSGPSISVPSSSLSHPLKRNKYANASGSLRKFSKRLSKCFSNSVMRRSSSFAESLPDTPKGWMALSCVTMSAILAYEVRLQKALTKPPITFCQLPSGSFVEKIYKQMTDEPSHDYNKDIPKKILSRLIHPSLFVGTRGIISSSAAYLSSGPSSRIDYLRFREICNMSQDGARIAVDWEVQLQRQRQDEGGGEEHKQQHETQTIKQGILKGRIRQPVVIILHGINNDSSFGYMKSLSRSFCDRGYISASMNFRGCGGVPLSTSRGYTAAYTGDLRSVVNQFSARLAKDVPMFLVGNSLGANIMTKYLGEEGMHGTLPLCVSGAASLGNPLLIDSKVVKFPVNILMALGVKKIFLQNLKAIRALNDSRSKEILKNGFLAPTISAFDNAVAPSMIRNNPHYPFETKIGYEGGEAYWFDASSYRYVRHITVPFLNITAQDDFLISRPSRNKLGYCLANPNVMIVETRCGGHLGWQESPPDSAFGTSSWANTASSDFFDAILKVNSESLSSMSVNNQSNRPTAKSGFGHAESSNLKPKPMHEKLKEVKSEALAFTKGNISRL
jgi:predicted alpha/beta-fold hydrolase